MLRAIQDIAVKAQQSLLALQDRIAHTHKIKESWAQCSNPENIVICSDDLETSKHLVGMAYSNSEVLPIRMHCYGDDHMLQDVNNESGW